MQYEFGKPQSPKETWEPFAREASGIERRSIDEAPRATAAAASLHLAVEDDAFEGRTSVCLPREAYFKRVDKLVNEFVQRDLSYDERRGKGGRRRHDCRRRAVSLRGAKVPHADGMERGVFTVQNVFPQCDSAKGWDSRHTRGDLHRFPSRD